jgi:heterodisulfide reductase subunit A-like polyferredoxin
MDVSPFTMGIHSVNPYSHFANYSVAQYALANEELLSRLPPLSKTVDALQAYLTPWSKEHPVCIIGAGPAGLYTAMILESLNIPYRLLEASSRVGGTHSLHFFQYAMS